METTTNKLPHKVVVDDCANLLASGVISIVSYDETAAILNVTQGRLTIGGTNLIVSELNVATGEIKVSGKIEYLQYTKQKDKNESIWKRLMK